MKFHYYPETDSLYINFAEGAGADNVMINDDIVADVNAEGRLIGLDIQHASRNMDLRQILSDGIPPAFTLPGGATR